MKRIILALCAFAFIIFLAPPACATDVQIVRSPGGIEAWLVTERSVPLIAIEFAFRGSGTSQDASDKQGLATYMAGLLDEGAGAYDSRVYQEKLQALAIALARV